MCGLRRVCVDLTERGEICVCYCATGSGGLFLLEVVFCKSGVLCVKGPISSREGSTLDGPQALMFFFPGNNKQGPHLETENCHHYVAPIVLARN